MYCEECGLPLGHGHAKWCNTLKPGYQSFVDTVRANLDSAVVDRDRYKEALMHLKDIHSDECGHDLGQVCTCFNRTVQRALQKEDCTHQWVDARNKYVKSGELCLKCHAIRAGNIMSAPCVHEWEIDGDRDVCKLCGTRRHPVI